MTQAQTRTPSRCWLTSAFRTLKHSQTTHRVQLVVVAMPPKSNSESGTAIPTRASARNRLAASTSSVSIDNPPARVTRSTRIASASGGPTGASSAKSKATASNGISELITKKLRPLTERNTGNGTTTSSPDADSGAAMLAATKKALRPVISGAKSEDREPIKVRAVVVSSFHLNLIAIFMLV